MLVLGDCSCSEYVNEDGYGNCQSVAYKPFCYVNQPSTCKDIKKSSTLGLQFSYAACENKQGKKCSISLISL